MSQPRFRSGLIEAAGLLTDLKQRGLLEDTLVIWGGEFGRTPMVQENNAGTGEKTAPGRDHHKECFSIWMAGGGVKRGFTYGATDEFGFGVTENLAANPVSLAGVGNEDDEWDED